MIVLKSLKDHYMTIPLKTLQESSLVAIEQKNNGWKILKSRYTQAPINSIPYSLLNKHIKLTIGHGKNPNFNKKSNKTIYGT